MHAQSEVRLWPVNEDLLEFFGTLFLAAANDGQEIDDFPRPDTSAGANEWVLGDLFSWMEYKVEASVNRADCER